MLLKEQVPSVRCLKVVQTVETRQSGFLDQSHFKKKKIGLKGLCSVALNPEVTFLSVTAISGHHLLTQSCHRW